jgi:Na+-transporting methylmalonyl-CoA/oxaloacetate decarboxylase gamma subunit
MFEQLTLSILITLVGMGLVFLAILLLWGVIVIITRLAKEPAQAGVFQDDTIENELRDQAAAAAVAIALAEEYEQLPKEFPLPPTEIVSAWQAVMRAKVLGKRGQVR